MGPTEFRRLVLHAICVSIDLSLMLLLWSFPVAVGFGFGSFWSAVNFWALQSLFTEYLGGRRTIWLFLWVSCKLPILYGAGALVLLTTPMSYGALIAGFHVPFVLLIVEAVYYQYVEQEVAASTDHQDGNQ